MCTRYDFFLVSQSVRQGTVNPTSYNVIKDTSGLKPDHLQVRCYSSHQYNYYPFYHRSWPTSWPTCTTTGLELWGYQLPVSMLTSWRSWSGRACTGSQVNSLKMFSTSYEENMSENLILQNSTEEAMIMYGRGSIFLVADDWFCGNSSSLAYMIKTCYVWIK